MASVVSGQRGLDTVAGVGASSVSDARTDPEKVNMAEALEISRAHPVFWEVKSIS